MSNARRTAVSPQRHPWARPSIRPLLAAPALAGVAVACLASTGFAQDSSAVRDSISVIDRGAPPARVWAVAEAPFKLLELPFLLLGAGAGWVAGRVEAAGWVPALKRFHGSLDAHGVRPWVAVQGPNSGIGPELRLGPARPSLWVHARGAVTMRKYWQIEGRTGAHLPGPASPVSLEVTAAVEDRPKDVFFGIGNASRSVDQSDYALRRWTVGGRTVVRAPGRITVGLGVDWMQAEAGAGGDDAVPDVDSTFVPSERPGFGIPQRYVSFGGNAEWNAGPRHSAARTGSWVAVGYRRRASLTPGAADAGLVSASAGVELPFDHRRRSVAFALYIESLRAASAGELPFHLLPTLGGPQSLPALRAERYRDRQALLAKIEYRYRVWSDPGDALWADAVLFTSQGMVAGRLDELALARLHGSTGVAIAVLTRAATVARFAVAFGAEGWGVTLAFGPTF